MSDQPTLKALFESLHLQYHGMVLQICLGYMKGDTHLARDMTQDVFINVWNALAKFRYEAAFKTWIYRITVNTCLQHIRSNKTRHTSALEETIYIQNIQNEETEKNKHQALYRAIGELPELDRLIMMMVLDELNYDDISKITGINALNLRVRIHRTRKKLGEILKKIEAHG
jgi:RNA polymerase sigma-70 factor (ECF subfamily)